jgi:arginine utilization protein RocB
MEGNKKMMIHQFEEAGLGKAPFTYIGYYVSAGSCDFCNTRIVNNFKVQSSDGKQFKVGCDCIEKVGDKGLINAMKKVKAEIAKQKRIENEKKKQAEFQELILNYKDLLDQTPHHNEYFAKQGKTQYDFMKFMDYKKGLIRLKGFLKNKGVELK